MSRGDPEIESGDPEIDPMIQEPALTLPQADPSWRASIGRRLIVTSLTERPRTDRHDDIATTTNTILGSVRGDPDRRGAADAVRCGRAHRRRHHRHPRLVRARAADASLDRSGPSRAAGCRGGRARFLADGAA